MIIDGLLCGKFMRKLKKHCSLQVNHKGKCKALAKNKALALAKALVVKDDVKYPKRLYIARNDDNYAGYEGYEEKDCGASIDKILGVYELVGLAKVRVETTVCFDHVEA